MRVHTREEADAILVLVQDELGDGTAEGLRDYIVRLRETLDNEWRRDHAERVILHYAVPCQAEFVEARRRAMESGDPLPTYPRKDA